MTVRIGLCQSERPQRNDPDTVAKRSSAGDSLCGHYLQASLDEAQLNTIDAKLDTLTEDLEVPDGKVHLRQRRTAYARWSNSPSLAPANHACHSASVKTSVSTVGERRITTWSPTNATNRRASD